ncbi:hypothetical protein TL16_g02513 [Triparma laevis f. inornata]|uniref:Glycoside hydrolase family 5 domain-containing protein n=1 Tax=Triparma laevis f. inornata TaxID=1714386 RepID=A0A9W7DVL1_9STRA|nr:hypothetical protein TL16_g02513 [Triparma laevis f. inornata]
MNDCSNSPRQGESQGPFDGSNYLPRVLLSNDTRLDELVNSYGFNSFRVQASWAALQPTPPMNGEFSVDADYLDALSSLVDKISSYGAYSLLDMHQDGLSTNYGSYDGIPLWLANLTVPRHAYPWPYKDALKSESDLTEAAGQNFGDIYHNKNGGLDSWAAAWGTFAERFANVDSVLGYELMNEPWAGDVYHDPTLFLPGISGEKSLQPAYDKVAESIRAVDNETLVFFEPIVWGMIHDSERTVQKLISSGFDHAPGGEQYGDKSVFSYHYYCWFAKNGDGSEYLEMEKKACDDFLGPAVFGAAKKTRERLGGASMMTEFGGAFFSPNPAVPEGRSQEELEWVLDKADEMLESWSFWDLAHFYDYPEPQPGCRNNDLDCLELRVLSRPYAQATAGILTKMHFDVESVVFEFEMIPDLSIEEPTEIFLPEHLYGVGFDVEIGGEGASGMVWDLCDDRPNAICVVNGGDGGSVTVTVTKRE